MRILPALALALALLTVASGYTAWTESQVSSTHETHTAPFVSWSNEARYGYLARIRPSALFNNSTTLSPGQGTLFVALVQSLNVSFQDVVNLTAGENVQLALSSSIVLSSPHWNYTLRSPVLSWHNGTGTPTLNVGRSFFLNLTAIEALERSFVNQTGYSPAAFEVVLRQQVQLTVQTAVGTNTSEYAPDLTLGFPGPSLVLSNLTANASGAVLESYQLTIPPDRLPYELALALTILFAGGTVVLGVLSLRRRRTEPEHERQLRDLTGPYREAIAETATPPRTTDFVALRSWQDLVHVADMLGRPILQYRHHQPEDTRHFFYVLDGNLQYVYLLPSSKRATDDLESPAAYR